MEIKLAKYAGFCFGVKRAMDIVLENADVSTDKIFTLGPLIHNDQVVEYLESKGVFTANNIDDIPDESTVIIRTHGIPKDLYNKLEDKKCNIIDATCPFVKKIHNIVYKHYNEGYQIIIVGDSNHPEVIGINGWCNNSAHIISSEEDFGKICIEKPLCIVVQTTFSLKVWNNIKKFVKTSCQSVQFFDTICSATEDRQTEAEKMADEVDTVIVIGGKHSSNTKKLVDICKSRCADTYHIETVSELPNETWNNRYIGVTAGASTPEWIIKEVISKMSEEKVMEVTDEISFAEELEKSLVSLKTGDIVKGVVIGITPTEVYVDLGSKADGIIPVGELTEDPSVSPEDIVKVGDEIDVFVVRVNDVEGTIKLSKKKLDIIAGQKRFESAVETKEILEGKVVEAVNGGVIVLSNGTKVFVPARQAASKFVKDLETLVGETVQFRLIDFNPRRRKIVGSIKSVTDEVNAKILDEFWASAEVGKEYTGTVKSLTNFGAFVDIGGVDGLVHISELSWGRVKHPSDVLKVGDTVK
ncbi:MAG: bifunctional 4-hydroxy-3-methylbut-2-enyl diphosphate reductase/30S ribosomal protein S1, partial [Clostridia bacterium]|nr:bifunctional 4-hydroxy-3-methylbut-2-enyl diphosphate reductase/30S ribosomal protein S1 [Clostridia bacterium]